ncbi:DUF4249 domain-containing protein [Salibacteraceae bacterium]|nr:DUF4249 domain-containing protein [Salibacteraceae bacterium]
MKYSWILLFVLLGCVPEPIPLDIEQAESKIVVSTQAIPNQGMVVILTRSFSALSDGTEGSFNQSDVQQYLVTGANVTVASQNEEVTLQELTEGLYGSIALLQESGKNYNLKVIDAQEGKTVTASTQLQDAVGISNATARIDQQETTSIWLRLGFDFNDPIGKNYYMLNAYVNPSPPDFQGLLGGFGGLSGIGSIGGGEDIGGNTTGGPPSSRIPGLSNLFSDFSATWILNDEGRDGQQIQEERIIYNIDVVPGDVVLLTLSNISEEYYFYLQAREKSKSAIPFVTEPVTLPSNIEGGYGFFSMHYPVPFSITLQ